MIQKKTPRCSRVVLVEPTRTIYGHTIFKFTGKDGWATTGFIERENGTMVPLCGGRISAHRRGPGIGMPDR